MSEPKEIYVNPDEIPVDDALSIKLESMQKKEATPQKDSFLVESFQLFQREFNPKVKLVYYPCCGYDVSPSGGFPESRVIYLDKDFDAVKTLVGSGYEAVQGNAEDYELENKADVVFLSGPVINPDGPANQVGSGRYLICDNYHNSATLLRRNEGFELIGHISNQDNQPVLRDDAEEYLELPLSERNIDDLFVFRKT
jgi:hypothetical protein